MDGSLGMVLSEQDRIRAGKAASAGVQAPDGPKLDYFDALKLSQAIEWEANRAAECNYTKISLHMDLKDALALASSLRQLALLR